MAIKGTGYTKMNPMKPNPKTNDRSVGWQLLLSPFATWASLPTLWALLSTCVGSLGSQPLCAGVPKK